MATPGQLTEIIAAALGLSVNAVRLQDRFLSEAGLRTKGGRGRSAAQMTPRDAAREIIAVGGTPVAGPSAADTVERYKLYASLPVQGGLVWSADANWVVDRDPPPRRRRREGRAWQAIAQAGLPHFEALPDDHSAEDALTALLASIADGDTARAFGHSGYLEFQDIGSVKFEAPLEKVSIRVRIASEHGRIEEEADYYVRPSDQAKEVEYGTPSASDFRQLRFIGPRPLVRIALCLVEAGQ